MKTKIERFRGLRCAKCGKSCTFEPDTGDYRNRIGKCACKGVVWKFEENSFFPLPRPQKVQ